MSAEGCAIMPTPTKSRRGLEPKSKKLSLDLLGAVRVEVRPLALPRPRRLFVGVGMIAQPSADIPSAEEHADRPPVQLKLEVPVHLRFSLSV
jgi:hypothetical protein